jgi:hypothetical protein
MIISLLSCDRDRLQPRPPPFAITLAARKGFAAAAVRSPSSAAH